jgi:hypothetical protein
MPCGMFSSAGRHAEIHESGYLVVLFSCFRLAPRRVKLLYKVVHLSYFRLAPRGAYGRGAKWYIYISVIWHKSASILSAYPDVYSPYLQYSKEQIMGIKLNLKYHINIRIMKETIYDFNSK